MTPDDLRAKARAGLQKLLAEPRIFVHLVDMDRQLSKAAIQLSPTLPETWLQSVIDLAATLEP